MVITLFDCLKTTSKMRPLIIKLIKFEYIFVTTLFILAFF